jgi:hypothetical protein
MMRLALVLGILALVPQERTETRFIAIDIYARTRERELAAWQIELSCDPAQAKIVGVEGAGQKPPYYDPAALYGGRIILASFTTESHPPSGRVWVARIHLEETGRPQYAAKVMAAASPGGERFEPTLELVRSGGK